MLHFPEVVALTAYFYVLKMGDMRWVYFEGAGLWWQARYIAVAETLVNICLNILLAKYFGVLGIILATLVSLFFIDFIFSARLLFLEYFRNGKLGEFFSDHIRYFFVTVLLAVPCIYICNLVMVVIADKTTNTEAAMITPVAGFMELFIRLLICTVISVIGYFLAYRRTVQFKDAKKWVVARIQLITRK